jgi:uncharacterized coiled-coil protein SlyX
MKPLLQFTTITPPLLIPFMVVFFGLAPMAQAVGPDTEGNIPGSNNGEGIGVLVSRTTGIWNTGTGFEALNHLTAGNQNTATGLRALFSDTSGGFNTATGVFSLFSNTVGFFNSATGAYSLASNTNGDLNTANGYSALYFNTEGNANTATGFAALYRNRASNGNTANGVRALYNNTIGGSNTANGVQALYNNTTGDSNTANGTGALQSNTTGFNNTAIGVIALSNNTTGDGNTALGVGAGAGIFTANNVIAIGTPGANVSDSCFIGNIYGVNEGGTISAVYINSNGQLGTQPSPSSRRFKKEIKPMDRTSEAILALKPVTFHYKSDTTGTPQFGLIAEEVAKVNPDLVVRDKDGEIYSVRYDAVNAMLLNEFLKEHRRVEELKNDFQATVAQQQKEIQALTAQLKEQAAQIQKVSAQLELAKSTPQTIANTQ